MNRTERAVADLLSSLLHAAVTVDGIAEHEDPNAPCGQCGHARAQHCGCGKHCLQVGTCCSCVGWRPR